MTTERLVLCYQKLCFIYTVLSLFPHAFFLLHKSYSLVLANTLQPNIIFLHGVRAPIISIYYYIILRYASHWAATAIGNRHRRMHTYITLDWLVYICFLLFFILDLWDTEYWALGLCMSLRRV
ncbi:hypothetical protein F5Y02DRAFT_105105 [Annulohypoxylon stygium]|nr:hypothetical protein F5Y02DRAFT_105105 [Annulohypoxylon stygium]